VLESPRLAELLKLARDGCDFVIIDLPPALGLADTLVVTPLLDGVLVVAEAGRTTQAAIRHTVDQLVQVGAVVEGGILNNVSPSRLAEYRYGYEYAEENGSSGGRRRASSTATVDEPAFMKPSTATKVSTAAQASTAKQASTATKASSPTRASSATTGSTSERKPRTAKPARSRRGKW
jgi:hypothetical protein